MSYINKISYSKNISWTVLDDEVFIFNEITNELSLLKGIMKDFWLLLSNTESFDEIITILTTEYTEENTEIISNRILRKIKELVNKNLITTEEFV